MSPTNTLFAAEAGSAVSFLVTAQDPEGGPLEIDLIGPAGSTISPAANTVISNSPAMVQFSWIPPASSTNQSRLVTMIFRDNAGLQTQCTFAINVTAVNAPPQFGLVSTDSTGVIRGSGASLTPSVSDDGRFVAFASQASNLIFGDSNGRMDIFRHDRITGKIVLVSVNTTGTAAAGDSSNPSISATGQQILFESTAEDLTANDSNGRRDVFIRDLSLNTTELVSVGVNGTSPTGDSFSSLMSDDGRTVAFVSVATNVVSNDHNNGADVFVRLRNSGTTVLASRTATGTSGNGSSSQPAIAPGGNYVAFVSVANNLVANDSNGAGDVFRFSVIDSTVGLASTTGSASANNVSFSPTVNSAGSVAFASQATNLTAEVNTNRVTDVFVRNFGTATTRLVSGAAAGGVVGNGGSGNPIFSPDGSQVLFTSVASDLVAGDTDAVSDVFLYHVTTLNKELISVAGSGSGDGASSVAPGGMSDDLRYVVFTSAASNLTPGDTNGANDVFLRDRTAGATVLLSRGTNSATGGNGASSSPFVSGNGSALVFASHANNLVANDTNALADIFAIATANSLSAFVTLSVRSAGADIHLEWPALQGGYHIEESSAVAPASNWTPATLPITTTNGVFRAVATPSPGPVYFQLRQTSGTR
ncbi:MAG: Tol biopolymer transport system component [Limisphaerales bacterium]